MGSRGRSHGPGPRDQQNHPNASYGAHGPSSAPTYPPQYASNYAPAYPTADHMQQRTRPSGAPAQPFHPGGPRAPSTQPFMVQGSYAGETGPPLPTSAPAYHGYAKSSFGGSSASGSQHAQGVLGTPHGPSPPPFVPDLTPSFQGRSPLATMNPWSMFSSVSKMGQNVQASQEYVSSKMSWFTGGFFLQLFQVDSSYVFKKLVMLMLPYLHKYDYDLRSVDRVEGNATIMAAPRSDLYAPDLYIPMLAMFTYVILAAGNKFANGLFTPDVVHSMVTWAVVAWGFNFAVLWTVMRLMVPRNPPPGVEIFAYSGYVFVNFCISILCGWLLRDGPGWHVAWLYTSTWHQMSQDNPSRRNAHLMLLMGGVQFVLSWLMGTTLQAREKVF